MKRRFLKEEDYKIPDGRRSPSERSSDPFSMSPVPSYSTLEKKEDKNGHKSDQMTFVLHYSETPTHTDLVTRNGYVLLDLLRGLPWIPGPPQRNL